jgi:hypothetical protein
MVRVVPAFLVIATLSGCGIADHFQAEARMNSAHDAYTKCLAEHMSDQPQCDGFKAVYEQDRAAFEGK